MSIFIHDYAHTQAKSWQYAGESWVLAEGIHGQWLSFGIMLLSHVPRVYLVMKTAPYTPKASKWPRCAAGRVLRA